MSRYFVFRVDADSIIGIGHLMRCLTLSKKLSEFGFLSAFICSESTNIYEEFITDTGSLYFSFSSKTESFALSPESYDAQETLEICKTLDVFTLIVDHYGLGINWEVEVRKNINRVMVVDDLADRSHDCFFLLDSSYDRSNEDYNDLVNNDAKLFLGTKFCILRKEFHLLRDKAIYKRSITKEIGSILLNFGGVDPMMHTLLSYRLIRELNANIKIGIIISKACLFLDKILAISNSDEYTEVYVDTDCVADIMLDTDLSIGSLGTTSWERCCLGLPSISLISAENQQHNASLLAKNKAVILSSEDNLKEDLVKLISNVSGMGIWKEMVSACFNICDGKGVYRVSRELLKSNFSLVNFVLEDSQDLFLWQLEDTARVFSRNTKKPEKIEHDAWVEESLRNNNRRMWVLKVDGINAGYVRLDDIGGVEEVSILISENFRNIGLASFAIKKAKTKSKYHTILAYVDSGNTDSVNLFVRNDFKEIIKDNYLWEF